MSKLGFPGMRSVDQLRSLSGSTKSFQMPTRSSSESITMGSFANLKLTAEKLVKEQASVKTDLDMANSKLKKAADHINALEEKLQNAINENAKLQVKQKEDSKLWKGLESKFSSTKALCDQLTETMQQLASLVRDAEQDKKVFEDKLSASGDAFDNLQLQFSGLSKKLESAEENLRMSERQLVELRTEKEEKEKAYMDEHNRISKLIEDKDSLIKDLEGDIAAEKLQLENLTSSLEKLHHELHTKDDICRQLRVTQENLEKEKQALQSSNNDYARSLLESGQEIKALEDSLRSLLEKSVELDKHSSVVSNHVSQLNTAFDTCYKLAQQEKELTVKHAQCQFDQLHARFLHVTTENAEFRSETEDLKRKIIELQNGQELLISQHAEERRLTEEKIESLEFDAKNLLLSKSALELQIGKLEENIERLSQSSSASETKVQDLTVQISKLETENQELQEQMQAKLQGKSEEAEVLQKEILKHEQLVDSLEKEASQLRDSLEEKEQLHLQYKDRERLLEDQRTEIQTSLALAENTLTEAKKQYDLMLESKQMELSKHLKEISLRNDQAINEIRRKSELEKLEIVNLEKEKAEKLVREMETKCVQNLAESKEEAKRHLIRAQEEHATLIITIRQEHDKKVSDLRAVHSEELRHARLEAEDDLREKTMLLTKEHEDQIREMRCQHEDELQKLQEELELQKTKEEKQRILMQMQWKVMDAKPQEDQEVTSKKVYSISSSRKKDSEGKNRSQSMLGRPDNDRKVTDQHAKTSQFLRATQTPVPNMLKTVEKLDAGGVLTIPKHRKVTHHEYEVDTTTGNTIKRRKTKSTVMFSDPTKHKRTTTPRARGTTTPRARGTTTPRARGTNTPRARASKDTAKVTKGEVQSRPSNNIGDLFSEGSLNPYVDDPYAFD
ncbi:hypothetical protein ACHQM5_023585 [Ranunculus cassubicifolius]